MAAPECYSCKIKLDGREYKTEDFVETEWKQSSEIESKGMHCGTIDVFCSEGETGSAESPFLKEEEDLLSTIADIVGEAIEHEQAKESLLEGEEKYRSLVSNISLGVFRSTPGPRGRFLEVNPAMERVTGYSREELTQMDFADLYQHPEEREALLEGIASATGMTTRQLQFKKKDGSEITVSDTKVPIRSSDGQVLYYDGIMEDITERKKIEEERQRAAKLESVGTLAGGIAHDFNNILTSIMGNISLATRYMEPDSKAADRLIQAEKASERARDLTEQLLTFARGGEPIRKIVSVSKLITNAAGFALRGSNVRPEISMPDNLWSIQADEGQLNQVITNLLINADEAMPEGGAISIGARNTAVKDDSALPLAGGYYLEIVIGDCGTGISSEHLPRIFEPYFTTKQKGSGLGLATTYSIVKNHGGHITVESELGVGTTFHIYLPALRKRPLKETKTNKVQPSLPRQGKILVMDDQQAIRDLLYSELSEIGYQVEVSSDGAEAIEKYSKAIQSGKPFDTVILDLTIPGGMGGKEAISKLLEIDPNGRVIASSGYSNDPIMSDYKTYGFSAVIRKPYNVTEMETTLKNVLSGR